MGPVQGEQALLSFKVNCPICLNKMFENKTKTKTTKRMEGYRNCAHPKFGRNTCTDLDHTLNRTLISLLYGCEEHESRLNFTYLNDETVKVHQNQLKKLLSDMYSAGRPNKKATGKANCNGRSESESKKSNL
ncbi:hypothetical protein CRM22_003842 [Opisthorchis felineus]|uniref:Uncharacterized protein n=1 Tax=Opisthorchis felineus TaxID=147828 RepID=A0A4S2M4C9_OPIFE|nr:hypothetical protein CRM22_003842 [Opisthorchis felineus]